jgi:outer membrane lipoprotein-sorting protein
MRKLKKLSGIFFVFALAGCVRGEEISVILQRMNQEAPKLHTMSANIEMVTLTAIIDSKITEDGTLKMQKTKDGVRAVLDFSQLKDSARVIGFFGKIAQMYYPKAKYVQSYDVGKNGDLVNQFLLLGFGSSGDELAASYTISSEGPEKIAGVDTTKLLLIPKDSKVKEHLSKVEIWIPEGQSNPLQQKIYEEPSGNYYKATYSDVRINPSFKGQLEIKMLPGTQKR